MPSHQPHCLRRTETVRHLNKILPLQESSYDVKFIIGESFERVQRSQTVGYALAPQLVESISITLQILRRGISAKSCDSCFFASDLSSYQPCVDSRTGKRYDLPCSITAKHHVVCNVTLHFSPNLNRRGKGPLYLRRSKSCRMFLDELVEKRFSAGSFHADAHIRVAFSLRKYPDVASGSLFVSNIDLKFCLVIHLTIRHRVLQCRDRLVALSREESPGNN